MDGRVRLRSRVIRLAALAVLVSAGPGLGTAVARQHRASAPTDAVQPLMGERAYE